jgi:Ricin-type beta-trefoil lectin domain
MQRALYVVARLIAVAVVLSVVSPVVFRAQTAAPQPIEIIGVLDGMCLQPNPVNNSIMEPGAAIVQEPCSGSPEQIWFWTFPQGVTQLMNGLSGLCLDARGPAADKTPVQQWGCPTEDKHTHISNENWEQGLTPIVFSRVSGTFNYCLDLPEGNTTPGVAMQIYSCNNSASQLWRFQLQTPPPLAPPPIEISSGLDGMCLQPMNKSMDPGAAIVQQTCTGFPEQIWFWTTPKGVTHLMNGLSGLCLDARGTAADKTPVQQWPCNQITNENWEAGPATGAPDKEILKSRVSDSSNYCLDTLGNSTPGVAMQIYSCSSSASQIWQFQAQAPPPGALEPPPIGISSVFSGMCLQPINKSMQPGAEIVEQACTGFPEQIWIWMTLSNGVSHLMNGLSGLCLDARGTAADTTPVQQWPCNQITNENWEAGPALGAPDKEILKSRVSGSSNYCLDTLGNSTPGAAMQIYSCSSSASQIWQLGGQSTVVPNVFGWQTDTAATWIEGFSLVPLVQLPASMSLCNANTAGRIVGEFPVPGTPALRNAAVTLYFCPVNAT